MIEAVALSKKYRIYRNGLARLKEWLTLGRLRSHEEFWALRDVSFKLSHGQCLGIIGANGAGKSTLLRILSSISKPTEGRMTMEGRVSSLLDLGLGFHPALSGRENVALSARFLGLEPKEVEERLESMIDFAELGEFIDRPVRTYSAGMYVRLGFAAAAGIDPDVLIVDEVLSVGDAYFQRKSLNMVEDMAERGKSIVIVSHLMPVVQRFCDRTLWLHHGRTRMLDETREVVKEYELFSKEGENEEQVMADEASSPGGSITADDSPAKALGDRWGTGEITIDKVEMIGEDGRPRWHATTGESVTIRLHCKARRPVESPVFGLLVHSMDGHLLFASSNYDIHPIDLGTIEGKRCIEFRFQHLNLNKGKYFLTVAVFLEPDHPSWNNPSDYHNQTYQFDVWSDTIVHGYLHMAGEWRGQNYG